ncbi:MAG: GNVR domain-containing protein [Myxococcales bacterium]|nr:hypothetical protein [Myxococcota bacterium]MDW8280910.1 GNVR domain-containing protein [Myxococcales bacterium]
MGQLRRGAGPPDRAGETWNLIFRFIQHWPLALGAGLMAAALGLLYARRYQPVYQAEVQVRLGEALDARTVPGQKEDPTEFIDLPDTLAAGFRARFVVDSKLRQLVEELARDPRLAHIEALRHPKGQQELIEHIKKTVLVEPITRRVFRLSYAVSDPDLVYIVAQRLAEMGVEDVIAERIRTARKAREFLASETEEARQQMIAAESAVVRFLRDNPKLLISPGGTERSKLGLGVADKLLLNKGGPQILPLQAHELSNSPQVRLLMQRRGELEARIAQIESAQRVDPMHGKAAEIERLRQQLAELKTQNYTPQYPEYQRLLREIERIQAEIQENKNRRDRVLAQDMRTIAEARAEIEAIDRQIAVLRRKISGEGKALPPDEQLLSAEAEYARRVRDMEAARAAYEKLRERQLEAQINEELSRVKGNLAARIEDPAKRPLSPRGISRRMMTVLCVVLGLLLGVGVGLLRAMTDPLIYTVFDLAKASRLPVLGRVPASDGSPSILSEVVGPMAELNGAEQSDARLRELTGEASPAITPLPHGNGAEGKRDEDRTGDYMVVYSAKSESSRISPGLVHGIEEVHNAAAPLEVAPWAQKAPAPRARAALFTSPQSTAFRLAGMGHMVHQGQIREHKHLFLVTAPDGARAEQYRLLRCRLQDLSDPRVLVVTSAVRGEGKTMAVANLALAYAEGGAHSVVMIDAHLSSPRLTELLGAQPRADGPGEPDLSSGLDIWQYEPNLFLVPALGQRVRRSAVLNSPAFATLVADLRQTFDYIIIDSPAVSTAADAKIVLRTADAGLFLTRARKTTQQQVRVALDRLGRSIMAGVVLNEFGP